MGALFNHNLSVEVVSLFRKPFSPCQSFYPLSELLSLLKKKYYVLFFTDLGKKNFKRKKTG